MSVSKGSEIERMEVEYMMKPVPGGDNFNKEYLRKVYDVLLRSIGKVGNNANFCKNYQMVKSIVMTHYENKKCISNLTDEYLRARRTFFLTQYALFDDLGIRDRLPTD